MNIAIVTGASSGFGKEFVKLFYSRRDIDEIWALARNKEKLQALKKEFRGKVKAFSIDLSNLSAIEKFGKELEKSDVNIKYLVNSAGFDKFGSYKDLSLEESVNMIDLNVSGVIAMGLVCLPYMKRGSHILNIASQASFQPLPYMNLYAATKAFLRNYSRALNVELHGKGVKVTAVCPGWMKTNLFARANIGAKKTIKNFAGITSPDKVARKALHDADKGKDISIYGIMVKCGHLFGKVLPQKTMMKIWLIQQGL